MKNYKIFDVLKSFDKKEFRVFGEFVSSPYFNKNKNVVKLFNALTKFYPQFEHKKLTVENLFSSIFPSEKFDYHKLSNIISDLYQLSEQYLAQIHIEDENYYIERNIFRQLRDRKLYKIYEQKHTVYINKLIEEKIKDENYFFLLYEMTDEYLWYATIRKPNTELNILQTEFDHFIHFLLIRLLRFYNLMLHERYQNNISYRMTLFNEILSYIEKNDEQIPVLQVFKTILFLLHTKEKKYYDELWELKKKYFDELKYDDQHLVFIHLYDYAAYMVNFKGDDSFNRDMFEIYKELLGKRFMTPDNFLYPNFMNVVKISCRVGEYDYAEKVIDEFRDSLPENDRMNVLEFCSGVIENSKGNYTAALKHFSKTNFQNFIFKVQVKILLLKIYYKLGMYEETRNMIDTFRHYISREKNLLEEHRTSYNIFLNLMSELIRAKESNDKNDLDFTRDRICKQLDTMPANPFRIKVWLQGEAECSQK